MKPTPSPTRVQSILRTDPAFGRASAFRNASVRKFGVSSSGEAGSGTASSVHASDSTFSTVCAFCYAKGIFDARSVIETKPLRYGRIQCTRDDHARSVLHAP